MSHHSLAIYSNKWAEYGSNWRWYLLFILHVLLKCFPCEHLPNKFQICRWIFFFPPSFSCRTHHFSWVKINVINLFHSNWHWKRTHLNPSNVWTERERVSVCQIQNATDCIVIQLIYLWFFWLNSFRYSFPVFVSNLRSHVT